MLLLETSIFYVLFGLVVAVAHYLRGGAPVELMAVLFFWPFYLPLLLAANRGEGETLSGKPPGESEESGERDALATAIGQVEGELDAALEGLDGWAGDVLSCEARRLVELRSAWRLQAERIRQLDRLLAEPVTRDDPLAAAAADVGKARHSEEVRRENMRQLAALRKQLHGDLIGTLAWVRELVTMIHLAKFSGAPAARAEELVAQIATAMQGLSEVSVWREEELVGVE